MVQRVQVVLEDDMDGSEATQTVQFGLDGAAYEIDLNNEHAAQLQDALASWVGHARRAGNARRAVRSSRGTGKASTDSEQLKSMREWGKQNGYQVSDRGRVSQVVRDAYQEAH